jgi:hypothetical protein
MAENTSRNWVCPFCNRPQTITHGQSHRGNYYLPLVEHRYGEAGLGIQAIACANPQCKEVELIVALTTGTTTQRNYGVEYKPRAVVSEYKLRPESTAKPQPDYIPQAIRDSYNQACRIRDLSPQASATLARRCLQGMVRDFCGIAKSQLFDELEELSKRVKAGNAPSGVTHEAVDAIDHVRGIGNIGAHMEKDVNVIVEIEPGEAEALIKLIELLLDEWYVARESRQQRLAKVTAIGTMKKQQLAGAKAQAAAPQSQLGAPAANPALAPPAAPASGTP